MTKIGTGVSRREWMAGLAGAITLPAVARAEESVFRAVTINHMSLTVPDLDSARDFYVKTLGMREFRRTERAVFLGLKRNYLALFNGEESAMNHFSPGIEEYDPARVKQLLDAGGYKPFARAPNIWACLDPDGIQNHPSSPEHREDQVTEAYQKDPTPEALFQAVDVNHVALRVADVGRSRDFYQKLFGLSVITDGSTNCFLDVGDNFLALFGGREAGGMDHFCVSVEDYKVDRAVSTLERAGLEPRRTSNRVYFKDLNGLTVQLSEEGHGV